MKQSDDPHRWDDTEVFTIKTQRPLASHCPFCHAPQTYDKLHTRFYACGTTGDQDKGAYQKECKAPRKRTK